MRLGRKEKLARPETKDKIANQLSRKLSKRSTNKQKSRLRKKEREKARAKFICMSRPGAFERQAMRTLREGARGQVWICGRLFWTRSIWVSSGGRVRNRAEQEKRIRRNGHQANLNAKSKSTLNGLKEKNTWTNGGVVERRLLMEKVRDRNTRAATKSNKNSVFNPTNKPVKSSRQLDNDRKANHFRWIFKEQQTFQSKLVPPSSMNKSKNELKPESIDD